MTAEAIILVAAGGAALLLAEGLYYLVVYLGQQRRVELRRRLRDVGSPVAERLVLSRERRIARSAALERALRPLPFVRGLEKLLLQTDLTWTVATVFALSIFLAGLSTLGFLLLLRGSPWVSLIGIPIGAAVPFLLVINARMRRAQKLSEQLPDALDMMVRSLRAGHGMANGFKLVAQEMQPPVAVEFGRCFEEQEFGVDLREALENMAQRVPQSVDLRIFAVSLLIQRETGGNLVEILEQIAGTVRERFKFYGKLRSLTAEGRMSGYILGSLPFLCFSVLALLRPVYITPLFHDPMGRAIAIGGLIMWALGVLWMNKIAKVDY
jgi:tight adherence protein B